MKKLLLTVLFLILACVGFAKGPLTCVVEIIGDPIVTKEGEQVNVNMTVRLPEEIAGNQTYHRIEVFIIKENDYDHQQHVSDVFFKGDRRIRQDSRELKRKGGKEKDNQWRKKLRQKGISNEPFNFDIKATYQPWMDGDVILHIEQYSSLRLKHPVEHVETEILHPRRE